MTTIHNFIYSYKDEKYVLEMYIRDERVQKPYKVIGRVIEELGYGHKGDRENFKIHGLSLIVEKISLEFEKEILENWGE